MWLVGIMWRNLGRNESDSGHRREKLESCLEEKLPLKSEIYQTRTEPEEMKYVLE